MIERLKSLLQVSENIFSSNGRMGVQIMTFFLEKQWGGAYRSRGAKCGIYGKAYGIDDIVLIFSRKQGLTLSSCLHTWLI